MTTDHTPPAELAAEVEQLRTENGRMRHELEVMYGGAFDSPKSAPADRAALRDRIAEALRPWVLDSGHGAEERAAADAVLAVLPPPVSRADGLREAADVAERVAIKRHEQHEIEREQGALDVMTQLRRMADEAQPGKRRCTCSHPADEHSVYGCADDCACEWMPKRKPPMDPVHILGIKADEAQAEGEPGCAHCGGDHSWDDCEAYTALVADEAQPGTEATS
ncbi:hypothetical protein ACFU3E_17120 [Streptomyces sp. NPDC057424]|uniref:hypothetical protein n=1 Tax=Streptomyces sp. NPDC057424 TaxID=3346127 RepID=UPI003689A3DB